MDYLLLVHHTGKMKDPTKNQSVAGSKNRFLAEPVCEGSVMKKLFYRCFTGGLCRFPSDSSKDTSPL